jgi:hypothetical protein
MRRSRSGARDATETVAIGCGAGRSPVSCRVETARAVPSRPVGSTFTTLARGDGSVVASRGDDASPRPLTVSSGDETRFPRSGRADARLGTLGSGTATGAVAGGGTAAPGDGGKCGTPPDRRGGDGKKAAGGTGTVEAGGDAAADEADSVTGDGALGVTAVARLAGSPSATTSGRSPRAAWTDGEGCAPGAIAGGVVGAGRVTGCGPRGSPVAEAAAGRVAAAARDTPRGVAPLSSALSTAGNDRSRGGTGRIDVAYLVDSPS